MARSASSSTLGNHQTDPLVTFVFACVPDHRVTLAEDQLRRMYRPVLALAGGVEPYGLRGTEEWPGRRQYPVESICALGTEHDPLAVAPAAKQQVVAAPVVINRRAELFAVRHLSARQRTQP